MIRITDALTGVDERWWWGPESFPGDGSAGLRLLDLGSANQYFAVSTDGDFFHMVRFYLLYQDPDNYVSFEPIGNDPNWVGGPDATPGYFIGYRVRINGVDTWSYSESLGAVHGASRFIEAWAAPDLGKLMFSMTTDGGFGASGGLVLDITDLPRGTKIGWDLSGGADGHVLSSWEGFTTFYGSSTPGQFIAATRPISDKNWIRIFGVPPIGIPENVQRAHANFRYDAAGGVTGVPMVPSNMATFLLDTGCRSGTMRLTVRHDPNNQLRMVMRARKDLPTWAPKDPYPGWQPWGWWFDGARQLARPSTLGFYGQNTIPPQWPSANVWSDGDQIQAAFYDVLLVNPVSNYCRDQSLDTTSQWDAWLDQYFGVNASLQPIQGGSYLVVNNQFQMNKNVTLDYFTYTDGTYDPDMVGTCWGVCFQDIPSPQRYGDNLVNTGHTIVSQAATRGTTDSSNPDTAYIEGPNDITDVTWVVKSGSGYLGRIGQNANGSPGGLAGVGVDLSNTRVFLEFDNWDFSTTQGNTSSFSWTYPLTVRVTYTDAGLMTLYVNGVQHDQLQIFPTVWTDHYQGVNRLGMLGGDIFVDSVATADGSISDSFNRADSGRSGGLGTTDTGQTWQYIPEPAAQLPYEVVPRWSDFEFDSYGPYDIPICGVSWPIGAVQTNATRDYHVESRTAVFLDKLRAWYQSNGMDINGWDFEIASYQWYVDSELVSTSESDTVTLPSGSPEVRLTVVDTWGRATSDFWNVNVEVPPQDPNLGGASGVVDIGFYGKRA